MRYPKTQEEWVEWYEAQWDVIHEPSISGEELVQARSFANTVIKEAESFSDSSRQILHTFVAAHTKLSEKQLAFNLAKHILRDADKKKGNI